MLVAARVGPMTAGPRMIDLWIHALTSSGPLTKSGLESLVPQKSDSVSIDPSRNAPLEFAGQAALIPVPKQTHDHLPKHHSD